MDCHGCPKLPFLLPLINSEAPSVTLALSMLKFRHQTTRKRKCKHMKSSGHVHLRFVHSNRANFTLPIVKKPIHPVLLPFSCKKLKGVKHESEQTLACSTR